MDFSKLMTEGIEVPPSAGKAIEFGGRVLTAVGARVQDGRLTLLECLEIAGNELGN